MYISKISLKNWKSYETAEFQFPIPAPDRNIILIGAPNGYGKTSLLEAIILGLFGQDGWTLLERSRGKNDSSLYRKFIEGALHRGALDIGRASCSVTLTLIDGSGEPLEIQRTWHFSKSGTYNNQDDVVNLFEGSSRSAVVPGFTKSGDKNTWIREYVSEKLVPCSLANFFLFDGEQVSELAEETMPNQIRNGIEGMLGIPVLRRLEKSLKDYERSKRRAAPTSSDDLISRIETEVRNFEKRLSVVNGKISEIEPQKKTLEVEHDSLLRKLSKYGVGSADSSSEETLEKVRGYDKAIEDGMAKIEKLLMNDLALALCGKELREKVINSLITDGEREQWLITKKRGDGNMKSFLSKVDSGISGIEPPLTVKQKKSVLECANKAWESLWYPPPPNIEAERLHLYLGEAERSTVIAQLRKIDEMALPEVDDILVAVSQAEKSRELAMQTLSRVDDSSDAIDGLRRELSVANQKLQKLSKDIGKLENEKTSLEGQLNEKRIELKRHSAIRAQTAPAKRRADRANVASKVVREVIEKSVPCQVESIAREMIREYSSMAHKKDQVAQIRVDDNFAVKLLDAGGSEIQPHSLSAGERQIFTQSLIYAVSTVSGKTFPMVIDTPLGRLDVEHRKGVLKQLSKRHHQVILLSTNAEVIGDYLSEIDQHVQKKYRIHHELIDNIDHSTVRPGYFGETEG